MSGSPEPSTQSSGTDLQSLLVGSLDQRWQTYLAELRRCQKKCSEAAVHDLRVATRRLMSTLDLIATVLVDQRLEKVRQQLKKRLKLFGPLRDIQVQLRRVEKMRVSHPEVESFFTILLLRERRLLKRIDRQLRKVRPAGMEEELADGKERLIALLDSHALNRVAMTAAVGATAATFAKTVALRRDLDPGDSETVHRLRVSFKKFRYMVEALQPALPGVTARTLKAMNAYQVRMGDIQDIEVFASTFKEFATGVTKRAGESFLGVYQDISREHEDRVRGFVESADELYTFWNRESSTGETSETPANQPAA